jgi:ankyrin repeat protein
VSGRVDIVDILLAGGADIHARSNNGDTPLSIATKLRSCFPGIYDKLTQGRGL